jgi:hypothetical protein
VPQTCACPERKCLTAVVAADGLSQRERTALSATATPNDYLILQVVTRASTLGWVTGRTNLVTVYNRFPFKKLKIVTWLQQCVQKRMRKAVCVRNQVVFCKEELYPRDKTFQFIIIAFLCWLQCIVETLFCLYYQKMSK